MKSLVSPEWLNDNFLDPNLIILDASTAKNVMGTKSKLEGIYIRGARKIDKNNFVDKNNPIPNTVLDAKSFEQEAQKLGISKNSKIVVYDNLGIYTSPRVWWMFKLMGHNEVYVLDGGLPLWKANGYPCSSALAVADQLGDFKSDYQKQLYRRVEDIQANINSKEEVVVDARSGDRFNGLVEEPRANLKKGHIPQSVNIHYADLLENGKVKSDEELKGFFAGMEDKPLVFTCGSGTTACILMLAADQVLNNSLAIYDGSWAEWGSREDTAIE